MRTALIKISFLTLTLAALSACSNSNSGAPAAIDSAGKHVVAPGFVDWVQQHPGAYKQLNKNLAATNGIAPLIDSTSCAECHGADLLGGVSKVSCFSATFNGVACHSNADRKLGHPTNWVQQHWVSYKQANPTLFTTGAGIPAIPDTTGCAVCHGTDLAGGVSQLGCFSATFNGVACHPNLDRKLGHPTGWAKTVSANFHGYSSAVGVKGKQTLSSCALCHATGDPGVVSLDSAPSCLNPDTARYGLSCHVSSPVAKPSGCGSCHVSLPPTGFGAHAQHLSLPNGQVTCSTCHDNAATATAFSRIDPNHATVGDPVVDVLGTFNAASGAASFDPNLLACSNVSCHGGQTVKWGDAGSFNLSTCTNCHTESGQFNSNSSGHVAGDGSATLHIFHRLQGIQCLSCHDSNKLAIVPALPALPLHFATLSPGNKRPATADKTLRDALGYARGLASSCTVACHVLNHPGGSWF